MRDSSRSVWTLRHFLLALLVGLFGGTFVGFFLGVSAAPQVETGNSASLLGPPANPALEFEVAGSLSRTVEVLSLLRTDQPDQVIPVLEITLDVAAHSLSQQRPFASQPVPTQKALERAKAYRTTIPSQRFAEDQIFSQVPNQSGEIADGSSALSGLLRARNEDR